MTYRHDTMLMDAMLSDEHREICEELKALARNYPMAITCIKPDEYKTKPMTGETELFPYRNAEYRQFNFDDIRHKGEPLSCASPRETRTFHQVLEDFFGEEIFLVKNFEHKL